jgi:two-component system NtrC family sensor kinase
MNLRGRLLTHSLVQVGALGTLFLCAGWFLRLRVVPILDEYLERKTQAIVLSLVTQLDVVLASGEPEMARAALADLASDSDLIRAEVRDNKGALVAAVGDRPLPSLPVKVSSRAQDLGDALGATAPIQLEGYPLGSLTVVFSKARQRSLLNWMMAIAIGAGLACLVSIAAAIRFSRSFVAPIHRMIRFAHRVKQGGLSERVAWSAREGELSRLAADLNEMAGALEARDGALAHRSHELEVSLAKLRSTQEELVHSTRLASVGEMAGRMAHEVLNPMTGIQARINKMQKHEAEAMAPNLETQREIVGAWRAAYGEGGVGTLVHALTQPSESGPALIDEDLANLDGIASYLVDSHRDRSSDLQFLLRESDRVVHIVDGMRSLTRASGTPARAHLDDLLRESIESLADSASRRNVALTLQNGQPAEIEVDRYEFVQILTNVLRNALLAIEEKSGRAGGQVTVATDRDDDKVVVRVKDDGCGIRHEHAPFLFEASFTTRSSRDGTGLGLSIARRLARGFGGELSLERSELGQGATFLLEIPLARPKTVAMHGVTLAQ